jgi:hypothetical protein
MFLFYRYYSKGGTRNIPYFSALCAVVFLIYIHLFQVLIVLRKVDDVLPMKQDDPHPLQYGKLALFLLPIFLIVGFLLKPKDIKYLDYEDDEIRKGNTYLLIYVITSVILLFLLMFLVPAKG